MKIRMIAAVSIAGAATSLPLAATAQADNAEQDFQTPSGNIACWVRAAEAGCDIGDYTYIPPNPFPTEQVPRPCSSDDVIRFDLNQGHTPVGYCHPGGAPLSNLHAPGLQTLGYGQTRSVGVMTCDSEPSGVTCTDTSTGHFFRVSRESYQVG